VRRRREGFQRPVWADPGDQFRPAVKLVHARSVGILSVSRPAVNGLPARADVKDVTETAERLAELKTDRPAA
jgi:hypothetical protein